MPTEAVRVNLDPDDEDNYLIVCATHDSVMLFPDPEFDYLRYYDSQDKEQKAYWLPKDILYALLKHGIPPTERESITEDEYQCYLRTVGKLAIEDVEVIEVDVIEAEVQKAHQTIDAELDYYLKEWE